jgi:hypothetical protein
MKPTRVCGFLLLAACVATLLPAVFYLVDYRREQADLVRFLDGFPAAGAERETLALVESLTGYLHGLPDGETTARMSYTNPLYRFLKARPLDVLERGGFCGNKSRLLVTLLDLRGIGARVAYLYNEAGNAEPDIGQPYVTAFVEVNLNGRWVVADPYLGVVFRNVTGAPATAAELASDPALIRVATPAWYEPEFFNYREIRGIRWGKFPLGEEIRRGIALLTSPAWANGIHYPWWAHRPNLVLSGVAGVASCVALIAGVLLLRRGARRPRGG